MLVRIFSSVCVYVLKGKDLDNKEKIELKRLRVTMVTKALFIFIGIILMQLIAYMLCVLGYTIFGIAQGIGYARALAEITILNTTKSTNLMLTISAVSAILSFIWCAILYKKSGFRADSMDYRKVFSVKNIMMIFFTAAGCCIILTFLLSGLTALMPGVFKNYTKLMSNFETGNMAVTLAGLLKDGDFWLSLLHSAFRICSGFLSAFFLGILLGSLGWAFPLVKEFLKPPMLMIRCVPVASFVILALIWIGSENLSVFISFLVVVPMIYGATLAGLENMDKKLLEMSQVFSMPFLKKVRFLFIPAVHPYLVSSCRTALGMSWKSGVAAEVIGIPKASIGEQLYYTKLYLDTSGLFAWTFSIILISAVFELVFLTLLKKVRH